MGLWSKVKKVGKAIKKGVETVVDVTTTAVNGIIETLESILSWIGSGIGFIVGLIRSFFWPGAIIRWILDVAKEIIYRGFGIIDFGLSLIGITPEKKLRICVIVLRIPSDKPGSLDDTVETNIINNLNELITAYKDEANIRIVPTGPFKYSTPFNDPPEADSEWIHFRDDTSASDILDVGCDGGAFKEDFGKPGWKFELIANTTCFYSKFRRFIGYGAPIIIFVVRDFTIDKLGCSLGPLTDYVTVSRPGLSQDDLLIAHEISHACGLWHIDDWPTEINDSNNIAWPSNPRGSDMRRWQIAIVRNSRHVAYL